MTVAPVLPDNYLFRWMLHEVDPFRTPRSSYYTVPAEKLTEAARFAESLHPGRILYTFDDGHSSDVDVSLPVLEKIGAEARGMFFVTTAWIGKDGFMTERQLRQLAALPVSIGTHGHTHGFFARMTDRELEAELTVSRQIVEGITGKPVDALSVPGGKYDRRLAGFASGAGYRTIFTSNPWDSEVDGVRFLGRYCIHRRNVDRIRTMYSRPGIYRFLLAGEHIGKNVARTVLGEERYYSLTSRIGKR